MNIEQTKNVLRMISAAYPNFRVTEDTVKIWTAVLSQEPAAEVRTATLRFIAGDHEWAPNPGQIRAEVLRARRQNEPLGVEAWSDVRRMAARGCTLAQLRDVLGETSRTYRAVVATDWQRIRLGDLRFEIPKLRQAFLEAYEQFGEREIEQETQALTWEKAVASLNAPEQLKIEN
ncbi:MAG: hypothetical protein E6Q97_00985 [Desulfurellales bacterium]|nr:MAG: hypothetical protein E6Q97_00985 [Desulfurellales bacterium]